LYPGSARAGFLPYQVDLAWLYIYGLHKIGGVTSFKDSKPLFLKNQLAKYKAEIAAKAYAQENALIETNSMAEKVN